MRHVILIFVLCFITALVTAEIVGQSAAARSQQNAAVVTDWFPLATNEVTASGAAPRVAPTDVRIWTAPTAGSGIQTLTWKPASDTTVVVMNADAHAGLRANTSIGATVPDLVWLAVLCFVVGGLLLGAATALVVIPVVRASR